LLDQPCSCLSEKKNSKDFNKACKKEVEEYEHEVSQDYRFNPRLKKSCVDDIKELCPGLCTENDGNVSTANAQLGSCKCLWWE